MRLRTTLIATCLLIAGAPALAANQRSHDDCNSDDADRRITGCTRIISDRTESKKVRGIAYVSRGLAWRIKGDRQRAIADMGEAIRLNPNDALAYNNRAFVWRELGEVDNAIADLTEAIRINPTPRSDDGDTGFVNAYSNRGLAFHVKGDYERALADYDAAIKLDPKNLPALVNRGQIHRQTGNHDLALADLDAAIRITPDEADLYHTRGMLLYDQYMGASAWIRKGDLEGAIADFSQMIRLDPKSGVGYYLRGKAHHVNGDRERAIADLIEGAKVDPIHVGIRTLLKELKPDYEAPKMSVLELLKTQ
jgi:tetratricopeptide (TPR) repeat protein